MRARTHVPLFRRAWLSWSRRVLSHNFTGPAFTVGIEEELMICDA
jgi:hypothetical protein